MDIATRRIHILKCLPKPGSDYIRPKDIGGYDRSHHSNDLLALHKLGYVEIVRFFKDKKTKGHLRYRLTGSGEELKNNLNKAESIASYRKCVLFNKNGIFARNIVSKE